jgi:hypothetical protein
VCRGRAAGGELFDDDVEPLARPRRPVDDGGREGLALEPWLGRRDRVADDVRNIDLVRLAVREREWWCLQNASWNVLRQTASSALQRPSGSRR